MPISGLVLTLDPRACADAVRRAIAPLPGVDAVSPGGRRVALVLDTCNAAHDRRAWQALEATPGVRHIDVVFIHFDPPTKPLANRSRDHACHR